MAQANNGDCCSKSKSEETLSVAMRLFQSMADKLSKQPENVPGQWYVDTSCALCRMCLEEAPNLITYNRDETAVHFFKQPETPEETAAAERAMNVCPTLAIGNDG
jgi:ferredoxin